MKQKIWGFEPLISQNTGQKKQQKNISEQLEIKQSGMAYFEG